MSYIHKAAPSPAANATQSFTAELHMQQCKRDDHVHMCTPSTTRISMPVINS
jgi:hypothetical protein